MSSNYPNKFHPNGKEENNYVIQENYNTYNQQPPPQYSYPPQQGFYPPMQQGSYPPQQNVYTTSNSSYYPQQTSTNFTSNNYSQQQSNAESQPPTGNIKFNDRSIRHAFIRKVYLLVLFMLLVTIGMSALFILYEPLKTFVKNNFWIYIVAWVIGFGATIAISCCGNLRRKTPYNYCLLLLLTLSQSLMIAIICSYHRVDNILIALGITSGIVLAITLFACQTKYDFTSWVLWLWVVGIALMFFGIFAIIFKSKILYIFYCLCGAMVFGIFLIVDTQMIMGGKRFELDPEEYIYGATTLFLDIITIFVYILQIVSGSSD